MHAARLLLLLWSTIASLGATCSTVSPTSAGLAAAPLEASRPTAVGAATIAAVGQTSGMFGPTSGTESSLAVAGLMAQRFTLNDAASLDVTVSAGAFRTSVGDDTRPVAGAGGRLWFGSSGPMPVGAELAAVMRIDRLLVTPALVPELEVRLLAAYRLPGRGSLWLTTRPGIYGWSLLLDPVLAKLEVPFGVAFDVAAVRVGAELGVDAFPAGGVWGARASASAAATF